MRPRALGAAIALVVVCAPLLRAADAFSAVVDSYLQIHQRLAADETEGVSAAAGEIAKQAESMGDAGAPIVAAARKVQESADLKSTREAFGALSDSVIEAARARRWENLQDVKVAFCSMANKSWLQKGDVIQNPYYGSQMLTCGQFQEK
jgi:hypothetical protein